MRVREEPRNRLVELMQNRPNRPLLSEREFLINKLSRYGSKDKAKVLLDPESEMFKMLLVEYLNIYMPNNISNRDRHIHTITRNLQEELKSIINSQFH